MKKKGNIVTKAVFMIIVLLIADIYFGSIDTSNSFDFFTDVEAQQSMNQQTQSSNNICCVDYDQGCMPNIPANICSSFQNSESSSDNSCETVNQCKLGCCLINARHNFIPEVECKIRADNLYGRDNYDFNEIFKSAQTEQACLSQDLDEEEGCCVDGRICSFQKKNLCNGQFNLNKMCNQINHCSSCKAREYKDCYDGSVYWFDSCGNREELIQQCNYEEGKLCFNENKGNENRNDDEVFCKNLDCLSTTKFDGNSFSGGFKRNGESWCFFDGPTGNFTDRPGSRHSVFGCVNGEEQKIEECTDMRAQVCAQFKTSTGNSKAFCIPNNVYDAKVTSNYTSVSKGFKFWELTEKNRNQCNKGTTQCTVVWSRKSKTDDWDCKRNCECETQEFLDKANTYCKSFGDCGFSYNIIEEEGSSGLNIFWSEGGRGPKPRELSQDYKKFLEKEGIYGGMNFSFSEDIRNFFGDMNRYSSYGSRFVFSQAKVYETLFYNILGSQFVHFLYGSSLNADETYLLSIIGGAAYSGASVGSSFGTAASYGGSYLYYCYICLLAYAVYLIFTLINVSGGGVKKKTVTVECNIWQPPFGGEDCKKCASNPLIRCDEYRCRSLGTTCELINEGEEMEGCVDIAPSDPVTPPKIEPLFLETEGYTITKQEYGFKFNEEIDPYKNLTFGVNTDEYATCRYDFVHDTDYEQMQNPLGGTYLKFKHNLTLTFMQENKEHKFFVKCMDRKGNANDASYLIRFKTKKAPDNQPPIVLGFNPEHDSVISSEAGKDNDSPLFSDLKLNEPAECRYDKSNKEFDQMGNRSICDDEFSLTQQEYICTSVFSGMKEGPNNYFFKCKDLKGNLHRTSFNYNLIRSKSLKIEIEDESPSGLTYTKDVTLSVSTEDGSENGKAICRFNTENLPYEQMTEFSQTNSNRHLQSQTNLRRGNYNYYIKCKDNIGNLAEEKIKFRIVLDRAGGLGGAELVNVYKDSSSIYVILDGASDCEYDNKAFVYGNGKKMAGEKSTVHTAPLEFNEYYIECKDDEGKSVNGIRINV